MIVVTSPVWGQAPESVQYRHVYTFGSKPGIHPPKALNRRPATVALGEAEHPYGLAFPVGVTTDNRRRVWITDSGTSSVHVFDPASSAYREIRRAGDTPLQQPSGIASDSLGRIYLTDSANGSVFVFDENGEFERSLLSKRRTKVLENPTAIAISGDARTIYVADPPRKAIVAFNREGETIATLILPDELAEPSSISLFGTELYVLGSSHRAGIFSAIGQPRGEVLWDGVSFPMAFTYDSRHRWFLVANPQWMTVEIFSEAGQGLGAFGQAGDGVDQFRRIDSLYVDPRGLVYAIDSRRGKVLVFAEPAGVNSTVPAPPRPEIILRRP